MQDILNPPLHACLRLLRHGGRETKERECGMYLRKIEGPRSVRLPDGTVMTRADLPPETTVRWVASRKAAVVRAVAFGLVTREHALETYGLSEEEFEGWERAVEAHGEAALRTTALQKYRQL